MAIKGVNLPKHLLRGNYAGHMREIKAEPDVK